MKFEELVKGERYIVTVGLGSMVNLSCMKVNVDGASDGILIDGDVYTERYYNLNEFEFRTKP